MHVYPDISIWKFLTSIYHLQKLHKKSRHTERIEIIKNLDVKIRDIVYYNKYATGIYGKKVVSVLLNYKILDVLKSKPDRLIFQEFCSLEENDIKTCAFDADQFLPVYVLSVDQTKEAIVLTIRGTLSIYDIFTDLNAEFVEYTYKSPSSVEVIKGMVHFGMLNCAQNLYGLIRLRLLDEINKQNYKLVINGHSLGAGIASLFNLILLNDIDFQTVDIMTFTYGCPSVISSNLNEILKDHVFSCIFGYDIVPELSFASIFNLHEVINKINNKETADEDLYLGLDEN